MQHFFKSIVEQDQLPVVIADLQHKIIYMNPAACKEYGKNLTGGDLLACHGDKAAQAIQRVVTWFAKDPANNRVHTFFNEKENKDVYMIALRDEKKTLIGYYEKFEYRDRDETPLYVMD